MIYQTVPADDPLRQGDIFRSIPRAELSLAKMAVISSSDGPQETAWDDLVRDGVKEPIAAIVGIEPVTAIVISQNCDAARGKDISLCAVEPLDKFIAANQHATNPDKWNNQLLKHAHSPRYFYLPEDRSFGILERMTADFRSVIRLMREDLLIMRGTYRIGRLNEVASEHLRESLAQFFRRYPVNEWYPLTKDEAEAYARQKDLTPDQLYDWQK